MNPETLYTEEMRAQEEKLLAGLAMMDDPIRVTLAGLRYEGMARESEYTDEATAYLNAAFGAFERASSIMSSDDPFPTAAEVLSQAHLSLEPLIRARFQDCRTVTLDELKKSNQRFVKVATKFAQKSRALWRPEHTRSQRYSELNGLFGQIGACMLLQELELKTIKFPYWLPLLAPVHQSLLADEPIVLGDDWHVGVYTNYDHSITKPAIRFYVRDAAASVHSQVIEDDVSVLWLTSDLAIKGENSLTSHDVIMDFANPPKRRLIGERMNKIHDAIDGRDGKTLRDIGHIMAKKVVTTS